MLTSPHSYNSKSNSYMFRCLLYYLQGEANEEYKVHCLAFHYLLQILLQYVFRSASDSLKFCTFIIALVYATSTSTVIFILSLT